jgi:hypothetical protein
MKNLALVFIFSFCSTAFGLKAELVPVGKTGAVKKQVASSQFTAALQAWDSDYAGSRYGSSPSGKALFGILTFKSGMPLAGLEQVLKIRRPHLIDSSLRKEVYNTIPPYHWTWEMVNLRGKTKFNSIFPISYIQKLNSLKGRGIASQREANQIVKIIGRIPDKNFKAQYEFQLMLWRYLKDRNEAGHRLAESLVTSGQAIIPKDRVYLAWGRGLYQQGRHAEAARIYELVDKDSDYWLEAVEESAWTYAQLKLPNKSLSKLRTATSPVFSPAVGPEPFFLETFINLKLCDFKQVYKSIGDFKETFGSRVKIIQELAKKGRSEKSLKALNEFIRGRLDWRVVGSDLKYLPRLFYRDAQFLASLKEAGQRRLEAKIAKGILQTSVSGPFLNAEMTKISNKQTQVSSSLSQQAVRRIQLLAKRDLNEMNRMLQKLHLVEAETIQRLYSHQLETAPLKGQFEDLKTEGDVLKFPANEEVWLDELDNYQVNLQSCPTAREVRR